MNKTIVNTCRRCGAEFHAERVSALWCSNACKQEAYRTRKRRDAEHFEAWKRAQKSFELVFSKTE